MLDRGDDPELVELRMRAYSGAGQALTEAEIARLADLELRAGRAVVERAESSRVRTSAKWTVVASVAALVLGGVGGWFLAQTRPTDPYIVAPEGEVLEQNLDLPDSADFDPGSAYLAGVVNGAQIWVGTRDGGATRCMLVIGTEDPTSRTCSTMGGTHFGFGFGLPGDDQVQLTITQVPNRLPFLIVDTPGSE